MVSGPVVDSFGGKKILMAANLIAGSMTLLTPLLVRSNLALLVASQIVCGVANGVAVPSFHTLLGRYEAKTFGPTRQFMAFTGGPDQLFSDGSRPARRAR